ncbi:DegV family protein [Finegoldia magna]|jgi:DegV family protein|uniref:DegV family protein n=1 Tax=Finegoldia magna TaxID=1260 RepID=UPI002432CD36|nr:DegV family protein [Finegoldia magna]MBS5971722.1 DegV family protein [Finegoldia magna]MDU5508383.1 DegV family protein [Finegoldia magna]
MGKIAILTDSGSEITPKIAEEYGIELMPLQINYSDVSYDDYTVEPKYIYENIDREVPKTSIPSIGDVVNKLNEIKNKGFDKIICISISSKLSGMYNAFMLAKDQVEDVEVEVFDSKNISIGTGFFAIFARKLIDEGFSLESIIETMKSKIKDSVPVITLDTLKYLTLGGRIGKITGMVGNLLNLKLIISCNEDGEYYTVEKNRGTMKNINHAIDIVKKELNGIKDYYLVLLNGDNKNAMEIAKDSMKDLIEGAKFYYEGQIVPTLSIHTGPGLFGIGYFKL